jgi:hypothetical protein
MNDKNLFKEDIEGCKFQTCEENQIDYKVDGENESKFGCEGYVLDTFAGGQSKP